MPSDTPRTPRVSTLTRAPFRRLVHGRVVATLLALGCAGRAELIRGDLTGTDLESLVDSDSARQVLVDLLARRPLEPRLEALAPSPLPADVVWERGTNASTAQRWLPDQ